MLTDPPPNSDSNQKNKSTISQIFNCYFWHLKNAPLTGNLKLNIKSTTMLSGELSVPVTHYRTFCCFFTFVVWVNVTALVMMISFLNELNKSSKEKANQRKSDTSFAKLKRGRNNSNSSLKFHKVQLIILYVVNCNISSSKFMKSLIFTVLTLKKTILRTVLWTFFSFEDQPFRSFQQFWFF